MAPQTSSRQVSAQLYTPRSRSSSVTSVLSFDDTDISWDFDELKPAWMPARLSEKLLDLKKHHRSFRPRLLLYIVCAAVLLLIVHSTSALSHAANLSSALSNPRNFGFLYSGPRRAHNAVPEPFHLKGVRSKYAFATFLAGTEDPQEYHDDPYLVATRLLAYQLLYAPETRSRDRSIPFIVLVTDRVGPWTRQRLSADGAIVVEVPGISADWIEPDSPAWSHVMTKLRLWEFMDFERIAFLDADTILAEPLDGMFTDPAAEEQRTDTTRATDSDSVETAPKTFVFAGNAENTHSHQFPPSEDRRDWFNVNYLNAGCFVLKPDIQLLKHYLSIMSRPQSFIPNMPEQNLLNEVHRREGGMPWRQLNTTINIHYPKWEDIEGGAKSIHEKWWAPQSQELSGFMMTWKARMESYYAGLDDGRQQWM